MQSLVVDTNSVIKKLEQRGFSRAQAEGITEALKELDASSLPTKADLAGLEAPTIQVHVHGHGRPDRADCRAH